MSMALFQACPPEQPHNRAVWSNAGCARLFRPFDVDSPPKGSLTVQTRRFLLDAAGATRCRLER
jgi:hypothetical protein